MPCAVMRRHGGGVAVIVQGGWGAQVSMMMMVGKSSVAPDKRTKKMSGNLPVWPVLFCILDV